MLYFTLQYLTSLHFTFYTSRSGKTTPPTLSAVSLCSCCTCTCTTLAHVCKQHELRACAHTCRARLAEDLCMERSHAACDTVRRPRRPPSVLHYVRATELVVWPLQVASPIPLPLPRQSCVAHSPPQGASPPPSPRPPRLLAPSCAASSEPTWTREVGPFSWRAASGRERGERG